MATTIYGRDRDRRTDQSVGCLSTREFALLIFLSKILVEMIRHVCGALFMAHVRTRKCQAAAADTLTCSVNIV